MPRKDARYSIRREWCGYAEPRWVARFCERWIGQSGTRDGALSLRDGHAAIRRAALEGSP